MEEKQGKKPTALFFNLEKRNYNRKSIKKLEGAEGATLTNEDEILNEIETFYKKLYNSGIDVNDSFALFLQSLKTPKLQDQQRNELEGEITLAKCKVVYFGLSVEGNHQARMVLHGSFIIVSLIY